MWLRRFVIVVMSALLIACGGGGGGGGNSTNIGSSGGTSTGGVCTTSFMGSNKLMVGAQMTDATAAAAPFDARYLYLAGTVRPAGACTTACSSACGGWWGCWQEFETSPGVPAPMGLYASRHIQIGRAHV